MDDSFDSTIGRTREPGPRHGDPAVPHASGRAITPRDLLARRHRLEQCASLSAEAALLAVLVARIGERECIVIYPGELVDDLSRCLHWRDTPEALHPRRIGAWLRHLGFSPVGRDQLGMKYEIRWEQLWELDPRELSAQGEGLDLFAMEGAELLRLLAHEQGLFFAPRLWCPTCHRVVATLWGMPTARRGDPLPCPGCGAGTRILYKTWLTWASDRIRRAIRQDRNLLPTVKAEWEEMHEAAPFPPLPESFGWLNTAWERAGKPSGRPAPVRARYELAHAVELLESAGVSPAEIEAIFEASGEKRQELYNKLSDPVHRFLGHSKTGFGAELPIVSPRTLWASVQWARRQWTNPTVRLRGEGTFPTAERKDHIDAKVPAESTGLSSSERPNLPKACLKCGNGVLTILEGQLRGVRCQICGWMVVTH